MDDRVSFTNEEFIASFIDNLKKSYNELEKNEQEGVDPNQLLQLIESFLKILNQIVVIEGNQLKYDANELIVSHKDQAFLQLMTFGGQLAYKIRTLLLKEDIDYLIGGQDTENKQLHQEVIPQSQILPNLKANLKANAVMLDSAIENLTNLAIVQEHINLLWQQIQFLSDISSFDNTTAANDVKRYAYTVTLKNGKTRQHFRHYYQKPSDDSQVYLRYSNLRTKENKYSYYNLNGKMSFFNDGWLFEWFNEYLSQEHGYTMLQKSLMENKSLSVMMKQTDTTAGYKGGDFTIGKQQIQAKFGNLRVISFKSIISVLTTLQSGLSEYIVATGFAKKEESIKKIAQIFTADNIDQINQSATITVLNTIKNSLKLS